MNRFFELLFHSGLIFVVVVVVAAAAIVGGGGVFWAVGKRDRQTDR